MPVSFTDRMRAMKQRIAEEIDEIEASIDYSEDSKLLDAVEQLCTAEKSFSYWASVAFGVKPRDVLRKILHEAQTQKEAERSRNSPRASTEQQSSSQSEGGGARSE